MDSKVLVSLIAVGLGWLLAQGTVFAKEWMSQRKIRRGLLVELEDIQDQLQRVAMIHARQLQMFALNAMDSAAALPIPNMFFTQYFKDAFASLNRSQRISYQLIHATLAQLNEKNGDLATFAEGVCKDIRMAPDPEMVRATIKVWGDRVIALYETTRDIEWHIAYHLRNKDAPSFDIMGPMHESYIKFQNELKIEVKEIIKKAKLLRIEDFK